MTKRSRSSNFTVSETDLLLELVVPHKTIIECKLTDCVSNNKKNKVWDIIENEFNSASQTERSATILRRKWDALKKCIRREYKNPNGESPLNSVIAAKIIDIIGVNATDTSSFYFDGKVEDVICEDTTVTCDIEPMNSECIAWSPVILRNPINQQLIVNDETKIKEPIPENKVEDISINTLSISSDTPGASITVNESVPEQSLLLTHKRKRLHRRKLKEKKPSLADMKTLFFKKKIKFLDLQMKLLQDEHTENKKRVTEKHHLEMEILKAQLLNMQK